MNKKVSLLFLTLISIVIILACSSGTVIETSKPTVALASPLTNSSYMVGQEVEIQAAIVDTKGISQVQLWVDGQSIYSQDVEPPLPSMTIRHSWVPDTSGNHIIEVRAYNTNNMVNEPVQVFITITETTTIEPTLSPTTEPTVITQASPAPNTPSETIVPLQPSATPITLATLPPVATPNPTDTPQYPTQHQPIIHNFTADRYTINAGEKVTLSWQSENARAYFLRYNGKEERVGNNLMVVLPINTTVYELVVKSDVGEAVKSLTVTVLNSPEPDSKPAIEYFYADPVSFPAGSCTTLYWKATGLIQEVKINYERVTVSGSQIKCLDNVGDFVYTLQVVGTSEILKKDVGINVLAPPTPSIELDVSQTTACTYAHEKLNVSFCTGPLVFSPDGREVAVLSPDGLYVVSVDGKQVRELIIPPGYSPGGNIVWSPGGEYISYVYTDNGTLKVGVTRSHGTTPNDLWVINPEKTSDWPRWTTDQRLLVTSGPDAPNGKVYVVWLSQPPTIEAANPGESYQMSASAPGQSYYPWRAGKTWIGSSTPRYETDY